MAKKQPVKQARKPRGNKKQEAIKIEESKNFMNDLIQAATEFFKAGTAYFVKLNNGAVAPSAPEPVKETVAAELPPVKEEPKKRTKKDAPVEDPMAALGLPPAAAPAPAAKPLTDAETYKLLMETATAYVTHFGQEKGIAQAKAHLKPFKLEKITDLKHEQRLGYIETLKKDLPA